MIVGYDTTRENLTLTEASGFEYLAGTGVKAIVEGKRTGGAGKGSGAVRAVE